MKSDRDFWPGAEKAMLAKVRIEALTFGAPVTDQQIRNAATRYCRTSPCEVQCLRPFKLHAHL